MYILVRPEATDEEVREAIADDNGTQIFSQALMNSNRRGQAESALSEVQSRHRDMQQIARTMNELAQLFHDMELMVAEQAPALEQIDMKAEEAQLDIERGVGLEAKAVVSARAARRKKWWCLLIIVIILVIIAIILAIVFGRK